jgi:hypothetical protein
MKYLLILFLVACNPVVSEVPVNQPVEHEETVSCHHYGYCWHFGKFQWTWFCDGKQQALVSSQTFKRTYEDGQTDHYTYTRTVKELTDCD